MFSPRIGVLVFAMWAGATGFARDLAEEIILVPQEGTAMEDAAIATAQQRIVGAHATAAEFERLGWAFVAKARRTQDAGFYKLAEKAVDVLDAKFGPSSASRLLRCEVLRNLHRFSEAEPLARQLVAVRGSPADLAVLSDVLVEQGQLAAGIEVLQRLANAKPGVEALTRIAHVRWLTGDLAGAIAAMSSAARIAGTRGGETAAWIAMRLANYQLQAGAPQRAIALLDAADRHTPEYAPALLARGRAFLAVDDLNSAVAALERAAALNPLPEYQWWLADALRATGRDNAAEKVEATLRNHGAASDPRTFSLFLATRGEQPARALKLARAEIAERHDVLTRDALAWALFASGEIAAAAEEVRGALAEHTRDARLFLHAGEIARANQDAAAAENFFAQAWLGAATLTPSERALLASRQPAPAASLFSHPSHPL